MYLKKKAEQYASFRCRCFCSSNSYCTKEQSRMKIVLPLALFHPPPPFQKKKLFQTLLLKL